VQYVSLTSYVEAPYHPQDVSVCLSVCLCRERGWSMTVSYSAEGHGFGHIPFLPLSLPLSSAAVNLNFHSHPVCVCARVRAWVVCVCACARAWVVCVCAWVVCAVCVHSSVLVMPHYSPKVSAAYPLNRQFYKHVSFHLPI
jgi:hypothetical protein